MISNVFFLFRLYSHFTSISIWYISNPLLIKNLSTEFYKSYLNCSERRNASTNFKSLWRLEYMSDQSMQDLFGKLKTNRYQLWKETKGFLWNSRRNHCSKFSNHAQSTSHSIPWLKFCFLTWLMASKIFQLKLYGLNKSLTRVWISD